MWLLEAANGCARDLTAESSRCDCRPPALQLEVEGANFVSGAVVNFNGAAQVTTFVNSTKLEATIPAAAIANPANVPVTVTDPAKGSMYGGMGSITSTAMTFTVN
jgi:hypothetical protein